MALKKSAVVANLVMATISELQKEKGRSTVRDVKTRMVEKYGNQADKFVGLVPQFIHKGMNLGLIAKYGDNYRTKVYVAKRRRGRRGKRDGGNGGGRRRRRRRKH